MKTNEQSNFRQNDPNFQNQFRDIKTTPPITPEGPLDSLTVHYETQKCGCPYDEGSGASEYWYQGCYEGYKRGFAQGVASERAESDRWRLKNIELDTKNEKLRAKWDKLKAWCERPPMNLRRMEVLKKMTELEKE